MSKLQVDENLARIHYILEMIEELNQLLAIQKKDKADLISFERYENMKKEFQLELNALITVLGPSFAELELAA